MCILPKIILIKGCNEPVTQCFGPELQPGNGYICSMSARPSKTNLFVINFITGMSDGLILPFVACIIAYPVWPQYLFGVNLAVSLTGGLAFGLARYWGEQAEIRHNHPQHRTKEDADKEKAFLQDLGLTEALTEEMKVLVEQDKSLWLKEIKENNLGWETYDKNRAVRSGWHTAAGFVLAGIWVGLPFCLMPEDYRYLALPSVFYLCLVAGFGWMKGKLLGKLTWKYVIYQFGKGLVVLVLAIAVALFIGGI